MIQTLLLCLLIFSGGCTFTAFRIDGPYHGRVIDADTNQPIEGVVAHADWLREDVTPIGSYHTYYDSRETVTDKDGNFSFPGLGALWFSNIGEMYIVLFKAGYTHIRSTSWEDCIDSKGSAPIRWDGKLATFKLKKMTESERHRRMVPLPDAVPNKKQRLLIMESNKENREIGLPEKTMLPVE